jgi:hypothetical protein
MLQIANMLLNVETLALWRTLATRAECPQQIDSLLSVPDCRLGIRCSLPMHRRSYRVGTRTVGLRRSFLARRA